MSLSEVEKILQAIKCTDNIKMNLEKIGCEHMDWIYLTQDMVQL
jgi:hypothetical protein